jgi:hypothetical protein
MVHRRAKLMVRVSVTVLAGLLLLCIAAAGVSALVNRGLPSRSNVVDRLHDLEKARLSEMMHLRQALGDAAWPGWSRAVVPIILYNEEYAFLVGHLDPPPGWVNVGTGESHGGPWEPVPGDTLQGQIYYRQRLPASGVTPQAFTVQIGGHWAASMTTREWTQIKLAAQIREELPPPLVPIFPYTLFTGVFNSDWHICAVLHETFHAYQGLIAEERLMCAEAKTSLEDRYPWADPDLQDAWQRELDLLAAAVRAPSDGKAGELASAFLAHREGRRRERNLGAQLVEYERQREWAEGLAKYVELEIWRQAATTPGYEPLAALVDDPGFEGYATFEKRWQQEVAQVKRMANARGDGRFYYSGMAQAVLLDRLMPGWKGEIMADGVFLEDLLKDAAVLE